MARRASGGSLPLLITVFTLLSSPAAADEESWSWLELRIQLPSPSPWLPSQVRSFTEARAADRFDGLAASFWRVGPLWDVHPNFFFLVQGTFATTATAPKTFVSQYRLELEGNFRGRIGPVSWIDRNRFEHRWAATRSFWVYRNQLRINVHLLEDRLAPFVSEELFIDLDGKMAFENRLQVGLGIPLPKGSRVDVAYQLRSRRPGPGAWTEDHVAVLGLFLMHAWN